VDWCFTITITIKIMIKLMDTSDGYEVSSEQKQSWILQSIVTELADDKFFLKKINQISFGLLKGSNLD